MKHWSLKTSDFNDKLQGNVATYLRRGGVVNNQITKNLLLSMPVKQFLKSLNIWQSYKQEDGCLVHFLRLLQQCTGQAHKVHKTQDVLACNFPKYSPIWKKNY